MNFENLKLIQDYYAFAVYEPKRDTDGVVAVNHGTEFRLKDGGCIRGFKFGTVVGYALDCGADPIAMIQDTADRMVSDPYAGHKMHWVNPLPATISSDAIPKKHYIGLSIGDVVRLEGRAFRLAKAPNRNIALVEQGK